jgi:hypothetical protein
MLTCKLFEKPTSLTFKPPPNNHTTYHPHHTKMASNTIENTKVLRLSPTRNADWTCSVCTDRQQHKKPFLTRENDPVYGICIFTIFETALLNDAAYPARWGSEELDPHDFVSVLSQDFAFLYNSMGEAHARERAAATARPSEPLEGQVPGRDYQLCPVCTTAISLTEGCNHMICHCGTSFCFICGLEARDGRGHWTREMGCPRWNAVGSGQERWDRDSDDMDISEGESP